MAQMKEKSKTGSGAKSSNNSPSLKKATVSQGSVRVNGKASAVASSVYDMSTRIERLARQQRRKAQSPPLISLSRGIVKGLQSECNAPLPLDKAAAERHSTMETSAQFFVQGVSSPLEKEDALALALREREAAELRRREKREREEIFAERLKHRVALLERTLRSAVIETIPPVKPRKIWSSINKQDTGTPVAKDEDGRPRTSDAVVVHFTKERRVSGEEITDSAAPLEKGVSVQTSMHNVLLQAQASSLRSRALLDDHQRRFTSSAARINSLVVPPGDLASGLQTLSPSESLPEPEGHFLGHVVESHRGKGEEKENRFDEGDGRRHGLGSSEVLRVDAVAHTNAADGSEEKRGREAIREDGLLRERDGGKGTDTAMEELGRGTKEGVRVGPMGVVLLRKRDEYEARGQGSQYFADVWKCAMEAERTRIQWLKSQQLAAQQRQKTREREEARAKSKDMAALCQVMGMAEEAQPDPHQMEQATLFYKKQQEEEARIVERREKRERLQQVHRSLEHARYTDARHASMVERVERSGVEVPPICSCGHEMSPLQPSYVFACANNCPLYHNFPEYQRILYATLHALGFST